MVRPRTYSKKGSAAYRNAVNAKIIGTGTGIAPSVDRVDFEDQTTHVREFKKGNMNEREPAEETNDEATDSEEEGLFVPAIDMRQTLDETVDSATQLADVPEEMDEAEDAEQEAEGEDTNIEDHDQSNIQSQLLKDLQANGDQPKRKRGRPRKTVQGTGGVEKKGDGVKKKRGRPRKTVQGSVRVEKKHRKSNEKRHITEEFMGYDEGPFALVQWIGYEGPTWEPIRNLGVESLPLLKRLHAKAKTLSITLPTSESLANNSSLPESPPSSPEGEEEHEIEYLHDLRVGPSLLIKWKGHEYPTWEPLPLVLTDLADEAHEYLESIGATMEVDTKGKGKERDVGQDNSSAI